MFDEIIDISRELYGGMEVWPGDPEVRFATAAIIPSEGVQVTELHLGTHSGTHIDAPAHFIEGATGIDEVPLDATIGPCLVIDLRAADGLIDRAILESCLPDDHPRRLLLKTSHGNRKHKASLDESAAHLLVERKIRLVGTEEMTIESTESNGSIHRILLRKGVAILEHIDLHSVEPGRYSLIALPLRLKGMDGSPCRAVLGVPT